MSTVSARSQPRMTVGEFLPWCEDLSDDARYELVAGLPIRLMAPISIRHARIQRNASDALSHAIAGAGVSCKVLDAGPGVAVGI
jgi:Uma2 family endonuclease